MSNHSAKPLVICLQGPTAAGKTDLAIELLNHFPCEMLALIRRWYIAAWILVQPSPMLQHWLLHHIG